MFRPLRTLRTLPPSLRTCTPRRTPFSLWQQPRPGDKPIKAFNVRFKKPGLTPRRLATFFLYSSCITAYIWYFVPGIEVEVDVQDADDQGFVSADHQGGDGDFEDSEFADDESLFIPLTWAKKLPREYYKGSDPEWQEFIKFAKDQPRHQRINSMFLAKTTFPQTLTSSPLLPR